MQGRGHRATGDEGREGATWRSVRIADRAAHQLLAVPDATATFAAATVWIDTYDIHGLSSGGASSPLLYH